MKKVLAFLLCVLLLPLSACREQEETEQVYVDEGPEILETGERRDTAVLFTANLASADIRVQARVSALWVAQGAEYGRDYLGLVDCGGAIDPTGEELLMYDRLEGMNYLGYDCAAVDARELAGGAQTLLNAAGGAQFDWLCANLTDENAGLQPLASWTVKNYGGLTLGFVGVCEPVELTETAEGEGDASFSLRSGDWVYALRDAAADCRAAGVDYVLVLGSLGAERAQELLSQTSGIDAYLDGSGNLLGTQSVTNINGEAVFVAGIAGGADEVGKFVISTDGGFSFESLTGFTDEEEMALQMLRDLGYDTASAVEAPEEAPREPAE